MSFFERYFEYVGETEAPMLYHRWTAISIFGALLGRQVHIPFGHGKIYPNQYIMLMGSPGTRKGTAMGIGAKLLRSAGYSRFCPDRLSKERFLMELKPYDDVDFGSDNDLETLCIDAPFEVYALAEEFTDFVGQGGMEFMTMLTKLWDNMSRYEHPKIHGKSIVVEKPTVNIFGGNTAQGLALAIPPEALNNGFTSRMIFVYSEPTGKKITFPEPVNEELQIELVNELKEIRENRKGIIQYTAEARKVLERCYKDAIEVEDPRFKHYGTRRFTHLLKLCMIMSIMEHEEEVSAQTAINANTILHFTERRMPKALGEFGKNRNSDVANTIIEVLNHAVKPMTLNELWKKVNRDLAGVKELADIIKNLTLADRVQVITDKTGKQGFMAKTVHEKEWHPSLINESIMLHEELS